MLTMILTILCHEYTLAMYGVVAWQLEEFFRSKKTLASYHRHAWREMGRALVWIGVIIVFDDEILQQYNSWAEQDYESAEPWMYVAGGFFVTIIRSQIGKKLGIDFDHKTSTTHRQHQHEQ